MAARVVETTLLMLWLVFAQTAFAFDGDYVWNQRFKELLSKVSLGEATDEYTLGEMYLNGRGTETDPAEALAWFLKAANQGHIKAAYKVGHLYLLGQGTERSLSDALTWLQRAAEAGYAPAQYELGQFYASNDAQGRESSLALMWLGRAKKNGYRPAAAAFAELVRRMVDAQKSAASPPR